MQRKAIFSYISANYFFLSKLIAAQEAVLEELYAPAEENGDTAEAGQETGEGSGSPKDGQTMEDVIQQAEEALSGSGVE